MRLSDEKGYLMAPKPEEVCYSCPLRLTGVPICLGFSTTAKAAQHAGNEISTVRETAGVLKMLVSVYCLQGSEVLYAFSVVK